MLHSTEGIENTEIPTKTVYKIRDFFNDALHYKSISLEAFKKETQDVRE